MEKSNELSSERNTPIFDHYQDISDEIEDPRLGIIVPMQPIIEREKNQFISTQDVELNQIFRLERCIVDVEEFISVIEKAEQRLQIQNDNIVKMVDYCYRPSNEEQTEFLFAGFYEMNDTHLEKEMELRGRDERQFTDLEIFNLIKEIINGLVFLQQNNFIHGDLR